MVARRSEPKNQTTVERDTDTSLVVTRTFNAPAHLVFDAWTKPELVKRWWAPRSLGTALVSVEADVRAGGHYRYVFTARGSPEMAFHGAYREVEPGKRLVQTEVFEPEASTPDDPDGAVVTVTFEARGDKTFVTSRSVYPSKEVLEMVIATGMETGMRESIDQLDELVASL